MYLRAFCTVVNSDPLFCVFLSHYYILVWRSMNNPTIPKEPKFHIPHHKKIKCLTFNEMRSYSSCCWWFQKSSAHVKRNIQLVYGQAIVFANFGFTFNQLYQFGCGVGVDSVFSVWFEQIVFGVLFLCLLVLICCACGKSGVLYWCWEVVWCWLICCVRGAGMVQVRVFFGFWLSVRLLHACCSSHQLLCCIFSPHFSVFWLTVGSFCCCFWSTVGLVTVILGVFLEVFRVRRLCLFSPFPRGLVCLTLPRCE